MTKATLLKKIESLQLDIIELRDEIAGREELLDSIVEEQNDIINTVFTKFGATDSEIDKAIEKE